MLETMRKLAVGLALTEDASYKSKIERRFGALASALEEYGDSVGTGHKRLLIPKRILGEKDLKEQLGFVPVKVAIPEAGQTRFESFRNPSNLFHLHEHGDAWIMHKDEHPASTMLIKKWALEKAKQIEEKGKATSSALKPVGDFIRGLPHVITEGLPGAYYYLKGQLGTSTGMRERVEAVTPREYLQQIGKWKDSPFAKAAEVAMRKVAAEVLTQRGEFAPGIPASRKIESVPRVKHTAPQTWGLAVQKHEAERAGEHADLRLVDNSGRAHSWAIPKGSLPPPGQKFRVIPQPTHTQEYAERKGTFTIPEGYGKGRVSSEGLRPVEVVRSQPDLLRFNVYGGQKEGNQEYALVTTPKGSLLHNITATAELGVRGPGGHEIPTAKPKYREIPTDAVSFDDPNEVHQAKVDGAHVTFHLRGGQGVKVFSYRPTERATGVLEHTHKLPDFRELKAPPGLAGTVLRGELYGVDKATGKAIPAEQTGGMLNATVWRSREKQQELGAELRSAIFDVVRYKGRPMEDAPYAEKLKVLQEVQRKVPRLQIPPMATTPAEKSSLLARIQSGEEPITSEGIVAWRLDQARPTKAKFRPDVDVEIVGVTQGKGKHEGRIGALQVRLPGKDAVTNVGTGFSDSLREQIAKNSDEYVGRVAKVRTMQVFPSGRLRAPSFAEFHLDKGKQPMEEKAAAMRVVAARILSKGASNGR